MTSPAPRTSTIWLGDAIRALEVLGADARTAEQILSVLRLRPSPRGTPRPPRAATTPAPASGPRLVAPGAAPTPAAAAPLADVTGLDDGALALTGRAPVVEILRAGRADPPERLPELSEVLPTGTRVTALPPSCLLHPTRQRAILGALSSIPAPSGEIDVAAVVERIVASEPLTDLPQLSRRTTRRGLQLLVDLGAGMLAFDRDQTDVRQAVELIAGPDGLEELCCHGSPLGRAGVGSGPVWTWTPYRPPPSPRPVLALTDLGLLSPPAEAGAAQRGWRLCAAMLREAGCPLVALTPVPPHRVPAELRRTIAVVSWDRRTTVHDGLVAARRAARRDRGRR